jgi:hypothetical protein
MTEIVTYKRLFKEPPNLVLRCRSETYEHRVEGVLCWSSGFHFYPVLFRFYQRRRTLTSWESREHVWYGWKWRWG